MKRILLTVALILLAATALAGVSNPVNGRVAMVGNDAISFIPDAGFVGEASFDYTITDGALESTATVTIIVEATPNRPPVANPDSFTMPQDSTLVIPVGDILGNDTDPDGDEIRLATDNAPN